MQRNKIKLVYSCNKITKAELLQVNSLQLFYYLTGGI